MTITCPRCGLAFETRATTNTRCRRCRHVVRVGRSSARPAARPFDETTVDEDYPTADEAAAGLAVLASFAAGLLVLAVPKVVGFLGRYRSSRAHTAL